MGETDTKKQRQHFYRGYTSGQCLATRVETPCQTDGCSGALGFSSSRTELHTSVSGEAVPGTYASEKELLAIARAVRGSAPRAPAPPEV